MYQAAPPPPSNDLAADKKRPRSQPPNQVWLDAIMSKTRSAEPSPINATSSDAMTTPMATATATATVTTPSNMRLLPPPPQQHLMRGGQPQQQQPHQQRPSMGPSPSHLRSHHHPTMTTTTATTTGRSSRTPSPSVVAVASVTTSTAPSSSSSGQDPSSLMDQQLLVDTKTLQVAMAKALKELVAEQNCCFIARGICHLCGGDGTNLVPVINFCPAFTPTHSLCREHLRSMHRVRLEDIFAGKNQPTVSKRSLRCTVCSLACPCSKCQLDRDGAFAKYKQYLVQVQQVHQGDPSGDHLISSRREQQQPRASHARINSNGSSSTPPPPQSSLPASMGRSKGEDAASSSHRRSRQGGGNNIARNNGMDMEMDGEMGSRAEEKRRSVAPRPAYYQEEKPRLGRDEDDEDEEDGSYEYEPEVSTSTDGRPPSAMLRAEEKTPPANRQSRIPKRAAKESVPFPVNTSSNHTGSSGYPSRELTPREAPATLASPSASSVLNCPDSEKSLVDLLSSLNQRVTPAVRYFADADEPRLRGMVEDNNSDNNNNHQSTGTSSGGDGEKGGRHPSSSALNDRHQSVDDVDDDDMDDEDLETTARRQKRKREAAAAAAGRGKGKPNDAVLVSEPARANADTSFRRKAPAPLTTSEKKSKPSSGSGAGPLTPSPRGLSSTRAAAKASASGAAVVPEPKASSRKRDAPPGPLPSPPSSTRKRKSEASAAVVASTDRKSPRESAKHQRQHSHKTTGAGQPANRQKKNPTKKKKKSSRESDDEVIKYTADDDDDDDMEDGEEEGPGAEKGHDEDDDDGDDSSELDMNLDYCEVCLAAGDLVCCDVCPRSFHLKCLKLTENDLPQGDWQCAECRKPSYFESFASTVASKTTVPAKCLQIIQSLKSHPFAKPFLLPVEAVPHYSSIVKQPMDLSTVERKLLDGKYLVNGKGTLQATTGVNMSLHLGSFAEDVRLVWANCKLFNDDGSGITRAADHLSEGFEKLYQSVLEFVEHLATKASASNDQAARREEKKPTPATAAAVSMTAPVAKPVIKPVTKESAPASSQGTQSGSGQNRKGTKETSSVAPPASVATNPSTQTKDSSKDKKLPSSAATAAATAASAGEKSSTREASKPPVAGRPRSMSPSPVTSTANSSSSSTNTTPTEALAPKTTQNPIVDSKKAPTTSDISTAVEKPTSQSASTTDLKTSVPTATTGVTAATTEKAKL